MDTPREEDIYDYQIGLDTSSVSVPDKHFFDISGYLVLEQLLSTDQVVDARNRLQKVFEQPAATGVFGPEKTNVIELGGACEDAMALPPVLEYLTEFIWGRQYRLVGSRGFLNTQRGPRVLSQGGRADTRRFSQYRCVAGGQFRCLVLTCLVSLDDADAKGNGFCCIPASHKANLPHPYSTAELESIPVLETVGVSPGSAILFTESLSHTLRLPSAAPGRWLAYHYGPSYVVDMPGCAVSADLRSRVSLDSAKSHLLQDPYYHPAGAQAKRKQ